MSEVPENFLVNPETPLQDTLPDTIVYKATGKYWCAGSVIVRLWDANKTIIDMDAFELSELSVKAILAGVNDGRFGVETILEAHVQISKEYMSSDGIKTTDPMKHIIVQVPEGYGKTGI